MSVFFIYHHHERKRVEPFADALDKLGFDTVLAPLGRPVGSREWWEIVRKEIEDASACLAFFSQEAIEDESFLDRVDFAKVKTGIFIQVLLDDVELPLGFRQVQCAIGYGPESIQLVVNRIARFLPRQPRRVSCFISYSRSDTQHAERLEKELRAAGFATWRDVQGIEAGSSWDRSIEEAVERCTHVLALVTAQSIASTNVADEISYAREHKKIVIPLLCDDSPLPMRMHRAQAVDFRAGFDQGARSLITQLNSFRGAARIERTIASDAYGSAKASLFELSWLRRLFK
jgi:hypothetical protein